MKFEITHIDPASHARSGILETSHGTIETPIFMPVGTAGTVKAVRQTELQSEIGAQIILGNTYHLYLRPGSEVLRNAGGLHRFMNWSRPILTDSGGYQVYSLSGTRHIKEEGVTFQSHIDGSRHTFTAENVVDMQRTIGADIIMAFDECTPYPCPRPYAEKSMHLTHRWLNRCMARFSETESLYGHTQSLFPIVQGSTYKDLRAQSAEYIARCQADGNAIGGLSVGEPHEEMYAMTELVCGILPTDKPRYLMGVGTPANILECIALGVDMFDCVMPTRNARNAHLFTWNGVMNMRNRKWENDHSPLDPAGTHPVDSYYTRAYLRHLFMAEEILALQIATLHNLTFYLQLVKTARRKIMEGSFASWKNQVIQKLTQRM